MGLMKEKQMRRNMIRGSLAAAAALALLAACTTDIDDSDDTGNGDDGTVEEDTTDTDTDEDADIDEGADTEGDTDAGDDSEWFDQAVYEEQREQLGASFEGDPDTPWLQYIDGPMTDTSEYATDEAQKVCFANASVGNPWRQTGWLTMQQQLEVLEGEGVISEMETRDASDNDDTQIADIDYFISEADCDAFIISPNSTAAMTPAVERACETGKPVVVFDRGVETDCATTFIHPVGGYGWGIDSAEFLVENLNEGDRVIALRILPGVDVLEHRWAAAERIFEENGIEAEDHFTDADPNTIQNIIEDALSTGDVHGVWMDAGDGARAAIEAFELSGADYPVMTGEDEMSFLRKWDETGLTGLAPVYSNFQWRTPLLALEMIFNGEEVPSEWVLPQEPITADDLTEHLEANESMPDGHYARFGGEDLPGYPEVWENR